MVTLKKYEAYLKVKRFIDGHDKSEIISRLIGDNKYVLLITESDGTNPIKYYSISAAAKHCGVTKQTLDTPIEIGARKQLGEKEELRNLESLGYRFTYPMDK